VRVPRGQWWLVALCVCAAIAGSFVLDRSTSGDGVGGGSDRRDAGG
jgi:hypothetical protein